MRKPCPYRLALEAIVGKTPPPWIRGNLAKFNEKDHDRLIAWIGDNVQRHMAWVTLHGVVDAVCLLVGQAKDNGNLLVGELDLEHRTDVEIAEEAEQVLGGDRQGAHAGWDPYKLHQSISVSAADGGTVRANTTVFVQRKDGEVYLRVTPDGTSYKITNGCHLLGIDHPGTYGAVPTL